MLQLNQVSGQCHSHADLAQFRPLTRVEPSITRTQSITTTSHSVLRMYHHVHPRLTAHALKADTKLQCRWHSCKMGHFMTIMQVCHRNPLHEWRTADLLALVIYMMTMVLNLHLRPSLCSEGPRTVRRRSRRICPTLTMWPQHGHHIWESSCRRTVPQRRHYHQPSHQQFTRACRNLPQCQTCDMSSRRSRTRLVIEDSHLRRGGHQGMMAIMVGRLQFHLKVMRNDRLQVRKILAYGKALPTICSPLERLSRTSRRSDAL